MEIWSASGLTESSGESGDIASAERQGTDWNEEKDDDDEASVGFEPSASPRLRVLGRVRHLTSGHTPAFDGKQEARAPPLS